MKRSLKPFCWTTRQQFLEAVGVVNADVELVGRYTLRFKTKYREVALRILSLARSCEATVDSTSSVEDGYVIRVGRFYNGKGRRV